MLRKIIIYYSACFLAIGLFYETKGERGGDPLVSDPKPIFKNDSLSYFQQTVKWFQKTPQFNFDSTVLYFERIEALLKRSKQDNSEIAVENYISWSDFYYKLQMFSSCGTYAKKAATCYYKSVQVNKIQEYRIKSLLSFSELFAGKNKEALDLFLQAEKIVLSNTNPEVIAQLNFDKSYFYDMYGIDSQFNQVLDYSYKSLSYYSKSSSANDLIILSKLYSRLFAVYEYIDTARAGQYFKLSESYALLSRDPYYLTYHLLTRADQQIAKKNFLEAKKYVKQAQEWLENYRLVNTNYYQFCLQYAGDIYKETKQYDSAVQYYKTAIEKSKSINYEGQVLNNLKRLSETYQLKGDYKNAFTTYQYFSSLNLKREQARSERSLKEHDLEQDVKQKQRDLSNEKKTRNLFIGFSALLGLLLLILLRMYRKGKTLNILLKKSNNEKDILLKEIHHRVKNNLTVISSLLEAQSNGMEDENLRNTLLEGQSRVKSIALIHQNLYQTEDLATVDFTIFLDDLYRQVSGLFSDRTQQVTFLNSVYDAEIDIDTAVPLGLICNELFTNSFKYAFTEEVSGEIRVTIIKTNEEECQLIYEDSGKGLPETVDWNTSKSMGLRLIQRLSKQLSGKAEYSKSDSRCKFTIHFKTLIGRNKE